MSELITQDEMATTLSLARAFHQSGFFKNVQSEAQAFVKIMLGREFGLGPAESMRSVYVINGKPAFEAAWIAGRIKSSGKYDYKILEHDDERCVLRFFEDGKPITGIPGPSGEPIPDVSFTMADARKADILKNPNYQKYPRNMLFARALTNGARFHTPDIFNGPIYTPDELRAGEGPEHVDVGALPSIEEIRKPRHAVTKAQGEKLREDLNRPMPQIGDLVPASDAQIQADLERLGLRPKPNPAIEAAVTRVETQLRNGRELNPWLHVLEGAMYEGSNLLQSAGLRLCELDDKWFTKAKIPNRQRMLTTADQEAIKAALLDPSRRDEALASLEQTRSAEQAELAFEDDAIPDFSGDRT